MRHQSLSISTFVLKLHVLLLISMATPHARSDPALVIPRPAAFSVEPGQHRLSVNVRIAADDTLAPSRQALNDALRARLASDSTAAPADSERTTITLRTDASIGTTGAYTLRVSPTTIDITGQDAPGVFYGIQTLLQMIPDTGDPILPCCTIDDRPRFAWRGLMLDSSRHIQSVDEIKQFIDQMAAYKYNVFHWHLTDDQGWRLEIKSRPKLTEIGAWRVAREGVWWFRDAPEPGEATPYGGWYSHEAVRDIVAYAAKRHITVVPEIDVPGHSLAILAAYPELSTTGGPFMLNAGSQFWGVVENTLDPSNPATFDFLEDVFREVAELFPGQYIHMGGDECHKGFWQRDPDCQALMQREGLADANELQSWFVRRVESIIESNGKRLIGWDEILEGGLAPNATVMSWRGTHGGIAAARLGHHVVMSPSPAYYLDLYQGHPEIEPTTYGMARLKDTYLFDPSLPDELDPNLLLGIQGNVWTEEIQNFRHCQYMTWPRALAIAESAWSPGDPKDWPAFVKRVEHHFDRFDARDWKYARSIYDPAISLTTDEAGERRVTLTPEIDGLTIHYTFDDTEPDHHYPVYREPLLVPRNAWTIRTRTYRDGQPIGRVTEIRIHKISVGKKTPSTIP